MLKIYWDHLYLDVPIPGQTEKIVVKKAKPGNDTKKPEGVSTKRGRRILRESGVEMTEKGIGVEHQDVMRIP
ncbi:hypothetical protein RIR_jg8406.t1 [Rhizophagus irregularis DAOM 181602=DAOM 197198]|nr:hypothetical protein RIR_jg8406.t1 [Rhizophagus irregularis DAOM 181602=DAOM 197198]